MHESELARPLPPLSIDAHLEAQVLGLQHPEAIAQQLAAGSGSTPRTSSTSGRKANGSAELSDPANLGRLRSPPRVPRLRYRFNARLAMPAARCLVTILKALSSPQAYPRSTIASPDDSMTLRTGNLEFVC